MGLLMDVGRRGKRKPRLLVPIRSFKGAVRVVNAGADEIYCDVVVKEFKNFVLYRGPESCIPTYDELGKVTKYAHEHNVKVLLTVNLPYMVNDQEREFRKHIRLCIDNGVDELILGNLGLLSTIKRMGIALPLSASTYLGAVNHEAVDFLSKLGFSGVTLQYNMRIEEIAKIVERSKVDIKIFIHGVGCSNFNGDCNLHCVPRTPQMKTSLLMIDGFNPACRISWDVYDLNSKQNLGYLPIIDATPFCSICKLPSIVQTGVAVLKIVDRGVPSVFQETSTKIYRELLDLIADEDLETFRERVDALRNGDFNPFPITMGTNLHEAACEQKRCYYPDLFHTPYKIPLSWHTWTKFQLKTLTPAIVNEDSGSDRQH